jgi:kexin
MSRDEYGFEMVEGHDADEDVNGGAAGGGRRNKRAGELYDAFAEGSDEETPFGLDSEDESDDEEGKERYRDGDQRGDMRS